MKFLNKILGRPIASSASKKQELSVITGVPALGLGALASMAYGPEAALLILLPLAGYGLHYFFSIMLAIVVVLIALYFSYMQTITAYPNGGGAYIVASDNLGKNIGVWAAVALLLDYLLNVAIGISAGVGIIVSAIPTLQPYTLILCLSILLMLTLLNLRGIRESGLAFTIPVIIFAGCMSICFVVGIVKVLSGDGSYTSTVGVPQSPLSAEMSIWLLLGALANGLTAMTGIEAVSNAVPLFRKPRVKYAHMTLTVIVVLLGLFLLAVAYLVPYFNVVAKDETQPGYQTILSQLVTMIMGGNNLFYYLTITSIFIVLTYSSQTSFAAFPRVCRLLAEDNFLPHFFADRGRRLVYTHGIVILAIFSGILLVAFGGITNNLIPLFAVGAFNAFLLSQTGMVSYWFRNKSKPGAYIKLMINALGATVTAIAVIIIVTTKFIHGAWVVILLAALLVLLFKKIRKRYLAVEHEIIQPLKLKLTKFQMPVVIIPIQGWDRVTEEALQFGLLLSDDVTALSINTDKEEGKKLADIWKDKVAKPAKEAKLKAPQLEVINSPYRLIYKPILDYIETVRKQKADRIIAVVIPELIEPHWYEYLLHNLHAIGLRALIFLNRDPRTVIITTPWFLHEKPSKRKKMSTELM